MASNTYINLTANKRPRQAKLFEFGLQKKVKAVEESVVSEAESVELVEVESLDTVNKVPCETSALLVLPQDISQFTTKLGLTSEEKYKVLTDIWSPGEDFVFPKASKNNRSFQKSWLKEYKWMCYSQAMDVAFCKVCVVFSQESVGKGNHQMKGAFVTTGFKRWKSALESFNTHQKHNYHIEASTFSESFISVYSGKETSIVQKFQPHRTANRNAITSITKTIIFCGRQNIALRGDNDHGRVEIDSPGFNDGKFRALLRFRIESGDLNLNHHLKTSPSNAMYPSPQIQNKLIEICGNIILETLVKRINSAQCFAILADETTDISTVEQLTLCVRYVHEENGNSVVREDFLKFVPVRDLTGNGLADTILLEMNNIGVDLSYLRGQSYDGAAAMTSKLKGVQSRILAKYFTALYTYCASHCLNLVITDASSIQPIRNMVGVIKEVNNFFSRSGLRKALLQEFIEKSRDALDSKMKGLISLCETRWMERHDSVIRFLNFYEILLDALETIHKNANDAEARAKALCLQKSMGSFDMIVSLNCAVLLLSLTLPVSRALQAKDADLQLCYEQIMSIMAEIRRIRTDYKDEFSKIYNKSKTLADKLDILIRVPRTCSRQTHRANYNSSDPEVYFRTSIFVPFLDEFLSSLESRFEEYASNMTNLLNILPRYIRQSNLQDFESVCEFYKSDITSDFQKFEGEYRLWKNKWSDVAANQLPTSVIETISKCDPNFFPNISKLLKILCTLPVTTATPERTFSTLRRLKTYLRNSMSETRLNGLAHLHIHSDIELPVDQVVQTFKQLNPRIRL